MHVESIESSDPKAACTGVDEGTEVAAGVNVVVTCSTTADERLDGTVTVTFVEGPQYTASLKVHGNDCSRPLANSDDGDGDGYTVCGGDCDDLNVEIRPESGIPWVAPTMIATGRRSGRRAPGSGTGR